MMKNNWDFIHWVIAPDGDVFTYGTKFIGRSNRLKYAKCHTNGEEREVPKIVSWDYLHSGQNNQLKAALGCGYRVLSQWEVILAINAGKSSIELKKGIVVPKI